MSSSGKSIFFAGMIAVFGVSGVSAAADDDMLRVYMDHARVLKLDRPVSKVIVGNAILDERILVSIDEGNTVRVYRQTERSVLSCTPNCEQHAQQAATGTTSP